MNSKSPDAFRTISEVADWLGVPAHVLRFWESRFGQVKPVKRAGGRRYYRPSDMELLGGIRKLLHEDGLTIRGVQKLLREKGVKYVAAMSPPLDEPAELRDVTPAAVEDETLDPGWTPAPETIETAPPSRAETDEIEDAVELPALDPTDDTADLPEPVEMPDAEVGIAEVTAADAPNEAEADPPKGEAKETAESDLPAPEPLASEPDDAPDAVQAPAPATTPDSALPSVLSDSVLEEIEAFATDPDDDGLPAPERLVSTALRRRHADTSGLDMAALNACAAKLDGLAARFGQGPGNAPSQ